MKIAVPKTEAKQPRQIMDRSRTPPCRDPSAPVGSCPGDRGAPFPYGNTVAYNREAGHGLRAGAIMASTSANHIEALRSAALDDLAAAVSAEEVERWRVTYLGRRGRLTEVLRSVSALKPEERPNAGAAANHLKEFLEARLTERREELEQATLQSLELDRIDITLPGRPVSIGRYHPLTTVVRDICHIFSGLGFQIAEGPEVEWDYYNFERMNIPREHPARDQWSTFWVDTLRGTDGRYPMLLRAHTSPMQARFMDQHRPPIRVVVPGKCWRYEATDATHESQMFQVEGLAVDKGITFANLRHTLYEFARQMFGEGRKVRFRCDYFPFVEPGADMSVDCFICEGSDSECRVCKGEGWIEIMGAGMVHPNVLRMSNLDPEVYTGFAFGMGAERIAMVKYGIDDIRLFYSGDVRFLRQFP